MITHPVFRFRRRGTSIFPGCSASRLCQFPGLLLIATLLATCDGSAAPVYGGVISGVSSTTTVRWSLLTAGTPSSAADSFVLEYQPPPVAPSYPQYDVAVANLVGTANLSSPYLVDVVDDELTNLVFAQQAFLQINSLVTDNFQSFLQGVPHDSLSLEIETILSFTLNTTAVIVAGQLGTAPITHAALDHAWVWSTNGIDALGTSISSPPTPNLTSALQDAAANGRSAPFAAGVHFVQLVTRVSTQNFDANGHTSVVAISDFDLRLSFAPYTAAIPEPSSQVLLSFLFATLLARRIIARSQSREVQ